MYIPFEIGEKYFLLKPYTTKQEKDFLLLSSFEVYDFDRVFELLEIKSDYNISDLSDDEKKILLYKFRDISLGDEIQVKFQCNECNQPNENVITTENLLIENKRDDLYIKQINKKVTDENLQEFILDDSFDVDELDLDEFHKLKQQVIENQIGFDFIKESACLKCGHINKFDIGTPKYIIEILSDDNLMSLYKTINSMVFFGHYTKEDIDNMMPFERTILAGLLKKTREDMTQ